MRPFRNAWLKGGNRRESCQESVRLYRKMATSSGIERYAGFFS